MTVSEGIRVYVSHKQLRGVQFDKGFSRLSAFRKLVADKQLHLVTARDVSTYLGDPKIVTPSWRAKHHILKQFLQFWTLRGGMPAIVMPSLPGPVDSGFVPYIYTKQELKALIRASRTIRHNHPSSIDALTLRALILTLYGTGAFVGQVLSLARSDVDLQGGFVTLRQHRYRRVRTVPVAEDLLKVLRAHAQRQARRSPGHFFCKKGGSQISVQHLSVTFRRVREAAGLSRPGPPTIQPRVHDLRSTFAVHRIEEWIKKGSDLNRMLPALSAYMGHTGLMASERYLLLAPERFRRELEALSPTMQRKHWRDDPGLMNFLAGL